MPLATTMAWRVVGASSVGLSHLIDGHPCQDSFAQAEHDDGRLVLAVADGAGSAARAAEGSALAVAAAVASPDDPITAARTALESNAGDGPLGDLATTLLVAAIDGTACEVWALGDGAVVVSTGDGLDVPLPPATDGPVNETTFVTSDRWEAHTRVATLELSAGGAVALLTDGLQLLALEHPSCRPHDAFFAPLLAFARDGGGTDELAAFLASDKVRARTDDDCTLLLATAPR